jgi:hypothetical protein
MILVDTSVLIDFFKGVKNEPMRCFSDIVKKQIPFGITSVIFQEILQGAKNEKDFERLNEYLSCQQFYQPEDEVASYEKAAQIYFSCRKKGITVRSTIDQIALEHDLFLLHNGRDFEYMAPVIGLKLYPV